MIVKAAAKINLLLDILGRTDDGYHTVFMVMQSVGIQDTLTVDLGGKKGTITVTCSDEKIPSGADNICWKAADAFVSALRMPNPGVSVHIEKHIPSAAGLAGGSTDCAAVLVGMNRLFDLHLSERELEELAGKLGSDIPYCVRRGTVLCEGVGEVMTNVEHPCPECHVVLAKLPVSVSTVSVYKGLKWDQVEEHPDTEAMLQAMAEGDVAKMGKLLCNVLETVTIEMHPKIAEIKKRLMELGAEGALMSGSGPTVFALFKDREKARKAAALIKREFALKDSVATRTYRVQRELRGEKRNG